MTKKSKISKYLTVTPQFPQTAYLAYVQLSYDGLTVAHAPMHLILTSVKDVQDNLEVIRSDLDSQTISLQPTTLILPMVFHELYPLKREYWQNLPVKYSHENRTNLLISALYNYPFYQLLVTPWKLDSKNEQYTPALPFLRNSNRKQIESFMMNSDFPVDEKSKYAAIYNLGEPFTLDWISGEIIKDKSFNEKAAIN